MPSHPRAHCEQILLLEARAVLRFAPLRRALPSAAIVRT
jgi:hypothetical protein